MTKNYTFFRTAAFSVVALATMAASAQSFFVEPAPLPSNVTEVDPVQGLVDTSGSVNPLGVKSISVKFKGQNVERNADATGEFELYKNDVKVASLPVAETYADNMDGKVWGFNFPGYWLDNGVYRVEIPAGVWDVDGTLTEAITLNYEIFHNIIVTPTGGVVDKIKEFNIEFPGASKVVMKSGTLSVTKDRSTQSWSLSSTVNQNSATLSVSGSGITGEGAYSLELPKGTFTVYYEGKPGVDGDTRTYELQSDEILNKYYMSAMPKPSIVPAEGIVKDFFKFTVTAPAGFDLWFIDDMGRSAIYPVLDDGSIASAPVYQLRTSQVGSDAVLTITDSNLALVDEPIVPAAGTYRLVLANDLFYGTYNNATINSVPYGYEYTITSETGVNTLDGDKANRKVELTGIYNMQGVRISATADEATAKALPRGLYIINGRKVAVK